MGDRSLHSTPTERTGWITGGRSGQPTCRMAFQYHSFRIPVIVPLGLASEGGGKKKKKKQRMSIHSSIL